MFACMASYDMQRSAERVHLYQDTFVYWQSEPRLWSSFQWSLSCVPAQWRESKFVRWQWMCFGWLYVFHDAVRPTMELGDLPWNWASFSRPKIVTSDRIGSCELRRHCPGWCFHSSFAQGWGMGPDEPNRESNLSNAVAFASPIFGVVGFFLRLDTPVKLQAWEAEVFVQLSAVSSRLTEQWCRQWMEEHGRAIGGAREVSIPHAEWSCSRALLWLRCPARIPFPLCPQGLGKGDVLHCFARFCIRLTHALTIQTHFQSSTKESNEVWRLTLIPTHPPWTSLNHFASRRTTSRWWRVVLYTAGFGCCDFQHLSTSFIHLIHLNISWLTQFGATRRFRDLADAFDVLVFPEVIPPEAPLASIFWSTLMWFENTL